MPEVCPDVSLRLDASGITVLNRLGKRPSVLSIPDPCRGSIKQPGATPPERAPQPSPALKGSNLHSNTPKSHHAAGGLCDPFKVEKLVPRFPGALPPATNLCPYGA